MLWQKETKKQQVYSIFFLILSLETKNPPARCGVVMAQRYFARKYHALCRARENKN